MAEDTANTSAYYYEDLVEYTCDNVVVAEFSHVFLPLIFSLVFVFGVLGECRHCCHIFPHNSSSVNIDACFCRSPGNGLVICITVMYRNQATMADICIFNLALSDTLFILMLPFYAHAERVGQWTFGDSVCHFVGGSIRTGFFSSIFFMVILTLDRYALIIHGHRAAYHRTRKVGVVLSLTVWLLSVCVSIPSFAFTKLSEETVCSFHPEDENWEKYDLLTSNILGLALPLLVMVFCYTRIVPLLVKMKSAKKLRVVKLIITVMVIFFVLWLPYNISLLFLFLYRFDYLSETCTTQHHTYLSVIVTEALAFTHCCLNPFIYVFVGQKFRRRALAMVKNVDWRSIDLNSSRVQQHSRKSSVSSRSSETFVM
ncbi:C-C chemokine receptor type 1-like [Neosynchiropus ocellatus]